MSFAGCLGLSLREGCSGLLPARKADGKGGCGCLLTVHRTIGGDPLYLDTPQGLLVFFLFFFGNEIVEDDLSACIGERRWLRLCKHDGLVKEMRWN